VFDAKIWLALTAILLLVVYIKKSLDLGVKYKNTNSKFSISVLFKDFMGKVRTNYAFLIFSSVLSAGVIAKIIKICVGRFRPVFFEAFGMTGFRPFSLEWAFNSMPSGHTTATFAGLIMAGMLAPKIKPVTWTLAIIVGLSRVAAGAHWPTDVILGAFIGMVAADVVKYLAFKRK
jgi:membrane-associated phospholipid phosphatase